MKSPPPQPLVHLVDDDDSLRLALERLLGAAGIPVRCYASAGELLLARETPLRGCLVLDIRMPGGPGGMELQEALARQGETIPIIFLTGHGDIPMSVRAMKAGAFDFLTKPVDREKLLSTVAAALAEEESRWAAGERERELHRRLASLTPSEREVLARVVEGHPNKRIAADLGCCERTVKAHRGRVMTKMGAGSLPELVQLAGRTEAVG